MPPRSQDTKPLNLLQTVAGLAVRPIETVDRIFLHPNPIHTIFVFILLLLTILTPVLASIKTHGRWLYEPASVISIILVVLLTFIYFVLIEKVFLSFLKVHIKLSSIAHAACYCVVPLIMVIWALYIYNIAESGSLVFVSALVAGVPKRAEPIIEFVPLFINFAFLCCFLIFFRALRVLGNMFNTNAFILSILSMIPFHLALILAIITANQIQSGTTDVFIRLLYAPDSLLN